MNEMSEQAQNDEIEHDRRAERHLIVQAIIALVVVAVFVASRQVFLS